MNIYLFGLIFIEIICLFILFVFNKHDLFSPVFLFIIMFFVATLCTTIYSNKWGVVFGFETFMVISSAFLMITIVQCFVSKIKLVDSFKIINLKSIKNFDINYLIKLIIVFTSFILMIVYILGIFKTSNSTDISKAIGYVHSNPNNSLDPITKLSKRLLMIIARPVFFVFTFRFWLRKQNIKHDFWMIIPMGFYLITVLFEGSRSPFLFLIFSFCFYYYCFAKKIKVENKQKKAKDKTSIVKLFIVLVLFLITFYNLNDLIKHQTTSFDFFEYFCYYIGSPLAIFGRIYNNLGLAYPSTTNLVGYYSFTYFYNDLSDLGLVDISSIQQNLFVYVGNNTDHWGNVYTIFAAPLKDFGLIGMYLYLFIFIFVFVYFYFTKIKANKNLISFMFMLFIFSMFYDWVFMAFYATLSYQLKFQTILELFFECLLLKRLLSLYSVNKYQKKIGKDKNNERYYFSRRVRNKTVSTNFGY